jgi:hypothetical protein
MIPAAVAATIERPIIQPDRPAFLRRHLPRALRNVQHRDPRQRPLR